jgi:hypothetical protein
VRIHLTNEGITQAQFGCDKHRHPNAIREPTEKNSWPTQMRSTFSQEYKLQKKTLHTMHTRCTLSTKQQQWAIAVHDGDQHAHRLSHSFRTSLETASTAIRCFVFTRNLHCSSTNAFLIIALDYTPQVTPDWHTFLAFVNIGPWAPSSPSLCLSLVSRSFRRTKQQQSFNVHFPDLPSFDLSH